MTASSPLRVCFMIDRLQVGGTEIQLLSLIRHLNRDLIEPSLCLLDGYDAVSEALLPDDCHVLRLGVCSFWRPRAWRKALELAAFLRKEKIDILQLHFPDSTYLGVAAGVLAGVPRIVRTRRGLKYWFTLSHRTCGRLLDGVYNLLYVDAIIANSDACRRAVIEQECFPPKQIEIIHNGIDLERFGSTTLRSQQSLQRVGVVARLDPLKNLHLFVRAAKIICDARPGVQFAIAGEGPVRPALETTIQQLGLCEQVALLGDVQDVPAFLAGLDVAVSSSDSEGSPNAVIEYMAAGKAIVATSTGGTIELIRHEREGLLVSPGDAPGLARAIVRLLDDHSLAEALGCAAQEEVRRYSFPRTARRYERFYQQLVRTLPASRRRRLRTAHTKVPAGLPQCVE